MNSRASGRTVEVIRHLLRETKKKPGAVAAFVENGGHWRIEYYPNPQPIIEVDEAASVSPAIYAMIEKSLRQPRRR